MHKKRLRKMALHTETLRRLDGGDLARAAGGATAAATNCDPPCPSIPATVCMTHCRLCYSYFITCLGPPMNC